MPAQTKTATAVAQTIHLDCPHCGEAIEDPRTGAYQITSDSFPTSRGECLACGGKFKLPNTARLFA
jgi:hypothetical protein